MALDAMCAMAAMAAGVSGAAGSYAALRGHARRRIRKRMHVRAVDGRVRSHVFLCGGVNAWALERAVMRSRAGGAVELPAFTCIGVRPLLACAQQAGLGAAVTFDGLCLARLDCVLLFAGTLAVCGALFSAELALVAALAGAVAGWMAPGRALRAEAQARRGQLERHLSEAIEVICLGLRSGLSFDRALDLYCSCFQSLLADQLALAHGEWSSGLCTREEALRDVQASYDSVLFGRVVDGIVRSLRFGSPLAETLEVLASEARETHKTAVEEAVMKAPVKMMVPVGTLILPSMLLMVLGPVMLELMG